jgi:large subunit ribosomal protein L10
VNNLAITREKKDDLIQRYVTELNDSEAIIITSYRGLKVKDVEKLRRRIRDADGSFAVVKNTLATRALTEAGWTVADDLLAGPVGIGFCHHNISGVAKVITDFSKENDLLVIKGGVLGTRVINEAGVKSLATLPSLEVVRAQFLGLLNSPASRLAGVVAGGVRQLVNVLNAYAEKDKEASAEA